MERDNFWNASVNNNNIINNNNIGNNNNSKNNNIGNSGGDDDSINELSESKGFNYNNKKTTVRKQQCNQSGVNSKDHEGRIRICNEGKQQQ